MDSLDEKPQDSNDDYDRAYTKKTQSGATPVTLDDEADHIKDLPPKDLWEESAIILIAETETHDVLLWNAMYILKGHGENLWIKKDGVEHDIVFIAVPKSQRGQMTDNNFARTGWHPTQRLPADALKIDRQADRTIWTLQDESFICRPPIWEVKGSHGGVELDLTYEQVGKAIWNWGPFSGAMEKDRAGYDVFATVNGTIKTGGLNLEIKNGQGVREHIAVGQSCNVIRNLPPPRVMWWLYASKDDIGVNYFRPGVVDIGKVNIGDREIHFNPAAGLGSISYQNLQYWEDPRSGYNLPIRWHLNMSSAEAIVDFDIKCHGRGYFHWTVSNGIRLYCYQLCTADGFVIDVATGRKVEFKDHVLCNSFNRTIYVTKETIDGPVI